jgi:undecaprenyl-diphosphatase
MKHLVHVNHHPHLKKRAILEFIGFGLLTTFVIFQRDILQESFATVLEVESLYFVLLLSCYWFLLPLTALSYKLISPKPKKINFRTTVLAHLAGSGPGRIIPGGIGNLSIGALHLKKAGLTIEQGIGVVITNNIFGLISNVSLLVGVLVARPETLSIVTTNISIDQIFISLALVVMLVVGIQWLLHARGTRREVSKTIVQWRLVLRHFLHQPRKVFGVLIIGLLVALIHTFMLDLSAYALGVPLGITDALVALSFGIVVGGVFPTPGGVGGVEAGITAALIVFNYDVATATSIAVLFRVATYWQPLIPGTLSYLYLRERKLL